MSTFLSFEACRTLVQNFICDLFALQSRQRKYYFVHKKMHNIRNTTISSDVLLDLNSDVATHDFSDSENLSGDVLHINRCEALNVDYDDLIDVNTEDAVSYVKQTNFKNESELLPLDLKDLLILWYLEFNISKRSLSALLKILSRHVDLPSTAETLLKDHVTKRKPRESNNYHYFGMKDQISKRVSAGLDHYVPQGTVYAELLKEAVKEEKKLVTLTVNIDGVSLFKSTTSTMWPILCRVNESTDQSPFVCAVYVGVSKPGRLQDFLMPFVIEYLSFGQEIFTMANGEKYLVKLLNVICDAPARSLCKGTKLYSGYNGCDYCDQSGTYHSQHKKIVYSVKSGIPRSDESFAAFSEIGHQLTETPLSRIVPMVTCFPPEPMHSVYLGVVRRLIFLWIEEKCGKQRLTPSLSKILSCKIVDVGKQLPSEFTRKPRPLSDIKHWKAVEFRSFLLYIGPIVLKDVLTKEKFEHFLLLHFSIYSLSSDDWRKHLSTVRICLEQFVGETKDTYGEKALTYNIHLLLHLTDFTSRFGQLDFWSAFWAESFLGVLRRRFRGPSCLLAQAVNRINEVHAVYSASSSRSFQALKKRCDCFYLTTLGIMKVEEISKTKCTCIGTLMRKKVDLYSFPVSSGCHNIGYFVETDERVTANIIKKCCAFNVEDETLIIPFTTSHYFGH